KIAPIYLAEDWDNVGLQVGENGWLVKKIWIALDPTTEVVTAACEHKVDLLITHHPLIFSALKTIDFSTPIGKIIRLTAKHKTSIFSVHTNLDNAHNGINDILAKKVGLKNVNILRSLNTHGFYKLVVFVPAKYEKKILDAIIETNVRATNQYIQFPVRYNSQEIFVTRKTIQKASEGKAGKIKTVEEIRIETNVHKGNLSQVIDLIRSLHPYGDMPYDIYPLFVKDATNGVGRIGDLSGNWRLSFFADHIRKKFGINSIKVAGDPDLIIDRVAVCSGSGSSLINDFISSGAQVFVSGDLRYHDARSVEQAGLAIIDIGHFVSEFIIVDELEKRLRKIFAEKQIDASVEACSIERDPYWLPANG
ncbi:MAG: Nif3-like dinuclear metal center hexameric protein, partial [Desulfobacterales bacterium]|nr:Nif3-like dinuclear metal center hexameric protein [Desulfobacterales bacterium]